MATMEQRARARKTRKTGDAAVDQGVKPSRRQISGKGRKSVLRDIPSMWRCEGQLSMFDDEQGEHDA
ncbi:hypothetical protein [Nocardia sp. NPDC050406]|uniref:hypothetical protein n=1 Tax=Nocardia sp. NPDC050406 TaxID=3364318 RepID=UPI0037930D5D